MSLNTKSENTNYCASVFILSALNPHPNADRLALVSVGGYSVITSKAAKVGEKYIHFPLECAINKDYLAHSNSFQSPDLNRDKSKKGFFTEKCRVKAVRLRSVVSEGYIVPAQDVVDWLNSTGIKASIEDFEVGKIFDSHGDILICEKYVNREALRKLELENNRAKKGKVKRASRLVDNQFRFHPDTENLKRNINKVNPEDIITISYKIHGSNAVFSKILTKCKLAWYEKFLNRLGVKISDTEYNYVFSSRRVVKNEFEDENKGSYYDTDIWSIMAQKINPSLKDGITIVGELVGQTPTGSWIQKDYHYGTKPGEMDFYCFRISYTNYSGEVFEFSTPQVQRYCAKMGIKVAPVFYYGKAKDLFSDLSVGEHWHENFLNKLKEKYTEKDCFMNPGQPEEGIVLSIEGEGFNALKLKSIRFLEKETASLDNGEVSAEDLG
jgi:hypothetical protein